MRWGDLSSGVTRTSQCERIGNSGLERHSCLWEGVEEQMPTESSLPAYHQEPGGQDQRHPVFLLKD